MEWSTISRKKSYNFLAFQGKIFFCDLPELIAKKSHFTQYNSNAHSVFLKVDLLHLQAARFRRIYLKVFFTEASLCFLILNQDNIFPYINLE